MDRALPKGSVQREARARGSDVWTLRIRVDGQHRNILLGKTAEMTEVQAHKCAGRERAKLFDKRITVLVGELIVRYKTEYLPIRKSTAASYVSMLNRIDSCFGKMPVEDLLSDIYGMERWLRDMQTLPRLIKVEGKKAKPSEPVSKRTKNHYKTMLHRLVECAMKWKVVELQRNPLDLVEVTTGARRKRVPQILTLKQYWALLERPELGEHCRTMVQLAMGLGLRASEILGLRWEDVDLLDGTLRIERSAVGKHQDETKTEASQAVLPLHPNLVKVLMTWRTASPVIEGWVFGSPVTERPYHRDSLHQDYLLPAARRVGLQRLGWHDFRHTYRAMLRDLDLPLEVQQKLMRHSNIAMTAHYGASPMDEQKRAANTMLVEHVTQMTNGSTRLT